MWKTEVSRLFALFPLAVPAGRRIGKRRTTVILLHRADFTGGALIFVRRCIRLAATIQKSECQHRQQSERET